jgi:hypothetical protein
MTRLALAAVVVAGIGCSPLEAVQEDTAQAEEVGQPPVLRVMELPTPPDTGAQAGDSLVKSKSVPDSAGKSRKP